MKKFTLAAALVFTLSAGGAIAQTPASPSIDQGDGFYGACRQTENLDACAMYLAGYSNGVLVQTLIDRQKPRYCLPPNLTRKDQLRVVLGYMKGHLEQMLDPTGAIIYKALLATFPCK
ncbi:Rap1a/Tai family immunity protein [Paraburkholderia sp. J67]|uniref:Rap1a/Tai family immunity protein n=1 Tax=Paraburkholderia sp. J67 TaxID=2805435 RepID=UPI002ABD5595|nr:Rap1a/Tai family immunity protein [Paraburkholderia sp. J67]